MHPKTQAPSDTDSALREMFAEMDLVPAIYRPSLFWQHLNRVNLDQIGRHGGVWRPGQTGDRSIFSAAS